MDTVTDLVTDLDDNDVEILTRLIARLGIPTGDPWPPRIEHFFRCLAAGLDEEQDRRRRMVQALEDSTGEGGVGSLADEDDEDLSGWTPDTGEAA